MSRRSAWRSVLLLAVLLLAACARQAPRPDAAQLAAQDEREQRLAGVGHWAIDARVALSVPGQGGSGSLHWERWPAAMDVTFHAPVGGQGFRLYADAGGARLDGLADGPLYGADAAALLWRATGWRVPLAELEYWVRGMRAPGGDARLEFDRDGLPLRLEQGGWTVEYRDWFSARVPPLPRRIFARQQDSRVRLLISDWRLP